MSDQLERKIDREAAGALALNAQPGGAFAITPRSMGDVMEFAKLMAISGVCVRPVFRGNPGACLAIAVQAMKWGADPFAVANKAYVVKNRSGEETIAYEAQLIHAIVNSSPVLQRRLRPVFDGQGADRRCRIVGWLKGESEALDYQSPPIRAIAVKNSPLWQGDPDQQLFYYSTRAWARRHVPEILLGIYAQDEFQGDTVEHGPEPRREDYSIPAKSAEPAGPEFAVVDLDGVENIYGSAGAAAEAMRLCLDEAARIGTKRLEGWWESNQAAIDFLAGAGHGDLAVELTQAYYDRRPKPADRPTPSGQQGAPDPASHPTAQSEPDRGASQPPRRARQARTTEEPVTTPPAEEQAPHAPPAGADEDAFGLPPIDHRMPPTEEPPPVDPTSPAAVRPGTPASSPPAGTPASGTQSPSGNGPTATISASRSDLEIAVPLKAGKRDWRTWALALLGPKVRRCTTSNELADLLGANEQNLVEARAALAAADLAEMERLLAERWQALPA